MTQINAKAQNPSPSRGHNSRPGLTERQKKNLEYMGSMIGELTIMAKGERAHAIAYFLEMAYLETFDIIRGQRPLTGRDPEITTTPKAKKLAASKPEKTAQLYKIC